MTQSKGADTGRAVDQPAWLWRVLACPEDRLPVEGGSGGLQCVAGHRFPMVAGVPVLVSNNAPATHPALEAARRALLTGWRPSSDSPRDLTILPGQVDPVVCREIVHSCGKMYRRLPKALFRYPIPQLPLSEGNGFFVDVGSNWGRWGIAAALMKYRVICLDPDIELLKAASRVAAHFGTEVGCIAGDARRLPLLADTAAVVFSYSLLQHFSGEDARSIAREMYRVCAPGGSVVLQMPNRWGLVSLLNDLRQTIRSDPNPFRVRRWRPTELTDLFGEGAKTILEVDGFFSLNPRPEDSDLVAFRYRALMACSELLRRACRRWGWLANAADSLWVRANKPAISDC